MTISPTQLSLRHLRADGWVAEVVERRIPGQFTTKDFLGFVDIIAIRGADTLAVQTTSYANVSARVRKIADSPYLPHAREAGWSIHVHGWRKVANRWTCRTVDLS